MRPVRKVPTGDEGPRQSHTRALYWSTVSMVLYSDKRFALLHMENSTVTHAAAARGGSDDGWADGLPTHARCRQRRRWDGLTQSDITGIQQVGCDCSVVLTIRTHLGGFSSAGSKNGDWATRASIGWMLKNVYDGASD